MTVQFLLDDYRHAIENMADETFDMICVDPPYGETALDWDVWPTDWPTHVRRLLKKTGSMWVFGSQRTFFDHTAEFKGWHLAQDVVWEKHNGTGLSNDRFRRVHELSLQFYRDDSTWTSVYKQPQFTYDAKARVVKKTSRPAHWHGATNATVYKSVDGGPRLMRSVIYARSEHGRAVHPTQKPIQIVEPLVRYSCPVGGAILDCFAGSGTTGIVAKRNGMDAVLIEANEKIFSIGKYRVLDDAPLLMEGA